MYSAELFKKNGFPQGILLSPQPFSEATAALIDNQAKQIIAEQYERAKILLKEKEHLVDALSNRLFEKETLVYSDLLAVLGPRPYGMKKEYENFVLATQNYDEDKKKAAAEKTKKEEVEFTPKKPDVDESELLKDPAAAAPA